VTELHAGDFSAFFRAIHGYDPFPWQKRLAERVCRGEGWPEVMDLPTASGKTAAIDVAVFAMALRQRGPRRVFFVVDRRVVVDAAYERMQKIAKALREAGDGVLGTVKARLQAMAGGEEPLFAYSMRGGIYRDDTWVRSPLQPAVIASTVDQVGSRLLFRGYGVSKHAHPIHAALVGNDSLILLDEAHCSRAFAKTLGAVRKYRGWVDEDLGASFEFVEMTATPARETADRFVLDAEDLAHPLLRQRLTAPKPARLVVSKAGKGFREVGGGSGAGGVGDGAEAGATADCGNGQPGEDGAAGVSGTGEEGEGASADWADAAFRPAEAAGGCGGDAFGREAAAWSRPGVRGGDAVPGGGRGSGF
jgi:CRISPR-associated endonuclease/helicase Cas3